LPGTYLPELPVVSTLTSHDSANSAISAVAAALRDIVFQDYSPRLPVLSNSTNNDRPTVISLGNDSATPQELEGFIQPADESAADFSVEPSASLTSETDVVNQILHELHNVEAPPTVSTDNGSAVAELAGGKIGNFTIDLQTDFAADDIASVQFDGGMVLLQSTGDANASSFDLTPMYAMQVDSFVAPVPMEASVGVYQALDVASDDPPMTESQPAGTNNNPELEMPAQSSLPLKREQNTTQKAASLVGVTAVTGAMVWMSRARRKTEEESAAAQKRRAISA
jgi:hypothetical protein